MKRSQLAFIIIFLVILAALFYITLDYPKRARNLPLLVIALAMIFLVRQLFKELSRGKRSAAVVNDQAAPDDPGEAENPIKYLIILGWLIGLVLLIWLLGFLIAFPLFILLYIKLNGEKWIWALGVSISFFIVVYVGFGILLEIPLYEGLLFQ